MCLRIRLWQVKQRESELVEASAVCAAYAQIVNVTARHDLYVCNMAEPHRFVEADCFGALLLHKS